MKLFGTTQLTPAVYVGTTRGKGSSIRMLHYCKQNSTNPSSCIQQFIHTKEVVQEPSIGTTIYSKNNTTDGGFQIGESIYKDMINDTYTYIFNPNSNQSTFFPDMADFVDANIVAGDKSTEDRLTASFWPDWGDDIFDYWGFFYLYDVSSGKYYFPLVSPQNLDDGIITTQTCTAFGRTFTIKHGYPVQGIFKFEITVNDSLPFIFGAYGNMGSDSRTGYENVSHPYSVNNNNLQLYYLHNYQTDVPSEKFYAYFIPKLVSQNNTQTYNAYYNVDYSNVMSVPVNYGVMVYFSKRYDVKEWVANDLGVQN
jgi:hypothetical protein